MLYPHFYIVMEKFGSELRSGSWFWGTWGYPNGFEQATIKIMGSGAFSCLLRSSQVMIQIMGTEPGLRSSRLSVQIYFMVISGDDQDYGMKIADNLTVSLLPTTISYTMATSSIDELGCAVHPDGTLKDASEIEWQYDKDDDAPMASCSSSSKSIASFFAKKALPANLVAGSRHSARTTRPSARILDPENAMNNQKRKAKSTPSRRISCKVVITSEDEGEVPLLLTSDNDTTDTEAIDSDGEAHETATAEFESLQAMADADHSAIRGRNVQDTTADIRTIFKREKEYRNPDSGRVTDGHWCKICLDDPTVKRSACFFTGSTSTLHMHIARHGNHTKAYLEKCKTLGIQTHPRALSRIPTESSDGLHQSNLDSIITREPRQPPFTTNGLMDYIVELVVREDEAFQLVERDGFHSLLRYCRPSLSDKDIPKRKTVRAEVIRRAQLAEEKVLNALKGWTTREHDILCMEHSLHIACKHFVETIAPASPREVRKKVRAALKKATGITGDLDLDELDNALDASEQVPNLTKNRGYADLQLTKKDWDRLEVVCNVLREPSDVQQTFSNEHAPTVWRIIPSLKFLIKQWETMVTQPQYREVKDAIMEGVISFQKWYRKYHAGMNRLEEVFDDYYSPPTSINSTTPVHDSSATQAAPIRRYGGSYLLEAVQSFQQEEKSADSPRNELKQYLESGPEPTDNVHQSNAKYPTLKRIA
ncbi:hypothetical protein BYT27DRAFT_7217371 [Phlegmacium glaucopus]|nr:hypothetical protein BYT27DRAFT_7217371 [Phlegmacium glaucopus]